jgi:hypothetical protein
MGARSTGMLITVNRNYTLMLFLSKNAGGAGAGVAKPTPLLDIWSLRRLLTHGDHEIRLHLAIHEVWRFG